jgi:phosphotransferase system HPr (HPr) family protein
VPASSETSIADVRVALPDNVDLHARPAAEFVRTAMRFSSKLWVAAGDHEADAKSLLSILAIGARRGTVLRLRASGEDAAIALQALAATVADLRE